MWTIREFINRHVVSTDNLVLSKTAFRLPIRRQFPPFSRPAAAAVKTAVVVQKRPRSSFRSAADFRPFLQRYNTIKESKDINRE